MKTAIKTFAIIGLVIMGLAFLETFTAGTAEDFGYILFVGAAWVPLSILSLIYIKK